MIEQLLQNYQYMVICGPTACGKTGLYEDLAKAMPVQCVNADTGQMYRGVGIGTAKPELEPRLHGFDTLDLGQNTSVAAFKEEFGRLKSKIIGQKAFPIVVGGSFFYVQALFYDFVCPGAGQENVPVESYSGVPTNVLYEELAKLDPERALSLEKNDRYRIVRALNIYQQTGLKPSLCKPKFNNTDQVLIVYIDPGQEKLDQRIALRLDQMLGGGWIDEVKVLDREQREDLRNTRGLIGYKEVLDFLEGRLTLKECRDMIFFQTRNYAKRQRKFFKMFERKIKEDNSAKNLKIIKLDRGEVGILSNVLKQEKLG